MIVSTFTPEILQIIIDCIQPRGFFLTRDLTTLFVSRVSEANRENVFMDYERHNVSFSVLPEEAPVDSDVLPKVSEEDVLIEEGQEVVIAQFSSEEQKSICHTGAVTEIDFLEDETSFTITPSDIVDYPRPVFALDRINHIVQLVGIIPPEEEKALHIHTFFDEERGGPKGILVCIGDFKGRELKKPGAGPRSIMITKKGMPGTVIYSLRLGSDGREGNPHNGKKTYNKDQPALYQAALESFIELNVEGNIPEDFIFSCYRGEEYLAVKISG